MFYSTELLNKKSPLGAIWIAAHGKRINRGACLGVNIINTCNKIMDPDVPQALRLQGILMGGVVIIYHKQQYYLLEDCNEIMKKLRSMDLVDAAAPNILDKHRNRARLETITLADLGDQLGQSLDLNNMLTTPYGTELADDLFLMPTLPEAEEVSERGGLSHGALLLDNNLYLEHADPMRPHHLFDMEQGEMFEVPELPDMEPLLEELGPPADEPPPPPPAPEAGSPPRADQDQQPPPAPPHGRPLPAPEEPLEGMPEAIPLARQAARRSRARKRPSGSIIDDPAGVQIQSKIGFTSSPSVQQTYREWIQDHSDLIILRPAKRQLNAAKQDFRAIPASVTAGAMWCTTLLGLFGRFCTNAAPFAPVPAGGELFPVGMELDDGRIFDEQDAPMLLYDEEEEIERLRAVAETPGVEGAKFGMGITPGSDPVGDKASSAHNRRKRPSSVLHPESEAGRISERSSSRSEQRSDLMLLGEGGRLEDMLPTVDEDELHSRGRTLQGTGLTDFQLLEDSAPPTQTPRQTLRIEDTQDMLPLLRKEFKALGDDESAAISLFRVTRGLSRLQAAKVFYQVCVSQTLQFIKASQDKPYGDIMIQRGVALP